MAIVKLRSRKWLDKNCTKFEPISTKYPAYQYKDDPCFMTDDVSALCGKTVYIDSKMRLNNKTPIAVWMIEKVIEK